MTEEQKKEPSGEPDQLPVADTGNASNPTPHEGETEPVGNQVLGKKAEKYLRESANIEDVPDPQEELDADAALSADSE